MISSFGLLSRSRIFSTLYVVPQTKTIVVVLGAPYVNDLEWNEVGKFFFHLRVAVVSSID